MSLTDQEFTDDELQAVLDAPTRKGRGTGKPKNDPAIRTLNTWFKLPHKFIQELDGLPEFSLAKCSNPACPNGDKPKGAICLVKGQDGQSRDMCRDCFIGGYGL